MCRSSRTTARSWRPGVFEARPRERHGCRAARHWRWRRSQLPLAALLLSDGYRVLVPDARAHGASGGAMLTAGITEALTSAAGSSGSRQQHPDECIFAIGTSFGGATLLQSLARTLYCAVDRRGPVCVGILDGVLLARRTCTAHRAMGADGSRRRGGFWIRAWSYGLPLSSMDAIASFSRSRVPLLVIDDALDDACRDATRNGCGTPIPGTCRSGPSPSAPRAGVRYGTGGYRRRVLRLSERPSV